MLKNYYNLVMNSETNGLAELPNIVKFQLMTLLSFMWSIVFTLMVGSYLVLGPYNATSRLISIRYLFYFSGIQKVKNLILFNF